jgi:protein TonB
MPTIKNYKADLKAKHSIYVKLSMAFVLLLLISVFKLSPKASQEKIIVSPPPDTILVKIPPSVQENKPPPPPKPKPIYSELDEVPEEIEFNDTEIDLDAKIGPPPPPPDPPIIIEESIIFVAVEKMPEPIGGLKAIQEKVHYTEIGRRAEIIGTVYIEAIIDEEGNVINAIVIKGIGGGLDESALNAVNLTKFQPGKQRGKAVKVRITIPIKFVLR